MKKILALIVVCAVFAVACSSTPTRRAFKEGWHDSVTTSKIKWKMTRDKLVEAHNINVDSWRGVVTLTGRAVSAEEKTKAEEIARQTKGVKSVRNYLDVVSNEALAENTADKKDSIQIKDLKEPAAGKTVETAKVDTTEISEPVRKNSVSNEIGKNLAATEDGEKTDDVTLQAERELKELKAKRKK